MNPDKDEFQEFRDPHTGMTDKEARNELQGAIQNFLNVTTKQPKIVSDKKDN
jgi:hypothetical protein